MKTVTFDNSLLDEIGLGALSETNKDKALVYLYDTIEARVSNRMATSLPEAELEEFNNLPEGDSEAAANWIAEHFPNYKDIYMEEFEKLKTETKNDAPTIISEMEASSVSE